MVMFYGFMVILRTNLRSAFNFSNKRECITNITGRVLA